MSVRIRFRELSKTPALPETLCAVSILPDSDLTPLRPLANKAYRARRFLNKIIPPMSSYNKLRILLCQLVRVSISSMLYYR